MSQDTITINCADCGAESEISARYYKHKRQWGQNKFYCPEHRNGRKKIIYGKKTE